MEGETCSHCGHYCRHYIVEEQGCWAINCGHCTYPRLKNRKPDAPICANYVRREMQIPVHKGYLTAQLVRWIQSLEYPPEIHGQD